MRKLQVTRYELKKNHTSMAGITTEYNLILYEAFKGKKSKANAPYAISTQSESQYSIRINNKF